VKFDETKSASRATPDRITGGDEIPNQAQTIKQIAISKASLTNASSKLHQQDTDRREVLTEKQFKFTSHKPKTS